MGKDGMDFTGQHVVITGASSGIGRATAERIARAGGTLTLIARRGGLMAEVVAALGNGSGFVTADVGDKAALIAALDEAEAARGPIDGLFCNAAYGGTFVPPTDYCDEAWEQSLRVNVSAPFWAIRHVLPGMITRRRGAILVTGSLAAERGMAGNIGYLASKHGVLGLARGIAMEVAAHGIRCNCLNPGFIDTQMLADVPDPVKAGMAAIVPQQRIGEPAEAGAVAAFLLSDEASHVTGQSWAVDGGMLGTLRL